MTNRDRRMGAGDWAILLVLTILWGGAFIFIEIALRGFPPMTLVFVRLTLAAALLWGYLRLLGRRVPGGFAMWRDYFILGFLNLAFPFILVTWGMTEISAGLASILNATTPLWGVLVAHLLTHDEKATPTKLIGVGFGVVGVAVMMGADALDGLGANLLAQIACLVASLSYALAVIHGRRFADRGVAPIEVATGHLTAAALLMLPLAIVVDRPWTLPAPGMEALFGMTCLVILSTAIAYMLYFRLLASAGATNSLLVTFLIPVFTVMLAALVLGETTTARQWAGMALIALGLVAIDGRLSRARAAPAAPPG